MTRSLNRASSFAALALMLGLVSSPAHALSLNDIRDFLQEMRGKLKTLKEKQKPKAVRTVYCGDLVVSGAKTKPSVEKDGCWYSVPISEGTVEFEFAYANRAIGPNTLSDVARQAQAGWAGQRVLAKEAAAGGAPAEDFAESTLIYNDDQLGQLIWLETSKQLLFVKSGRLYNVRQRSTPAMESAAVHSVAIAQAVSSAL